jgi:Flp pilus assembly pilin Flp
MDAIKRIFPLQSGANAIEYAVVVTGVCFAIAAVVMLRFLAIS